MRKPSEAASGVRNGSRVSGAGRGRESLAKRASPSMNAARCAVRSPMVANELLNSCDDPDDRLPDRDLLRGELARQALEQPQPMRPRVQQELPPGEAVHLALGSGAEGEERVAARRDRRAQLARLLVEQRAHLQTLEPAPGAQQLPRGEVAEHDAVGVAAQDERDGRGLQHRIEQQLARIQIEPLAAQRRAEAVVGLDPFAQLERHGGCDADAEIAVAQTVDPAAHRRRGSGARAARRAPATC